MLQLLFCRALLEKYQLTEFEKGMLINLAPEEIEEAKILVPSLEVHFAPSRLLRGICCTCNLFVHHHM